MKAVSVFFLCSALVLNALGIANASSYSRKAAGDYQEIMAFVLRTEKEGFHPAEFEQFALHRKRMQKEVYLSPFSTLLFQRVATASLAVGLLLLLLAHLKNKKTAPSSATAAEQAVDRLQR